MENNKLKINFIIPFHNKSGGILAVLEYYLKLTEFGHDVKVYFPFIPYWKNILPATSSFPRRLLLFFKILGYNLIKKPRQIEWHKNSVKIFPVPVISNLFIRNADICMATSWPTAYDVYKLNRSKGAKFYFIQGYEIWDDKRLVDASFRLPLNLITISSWLTNLLRNDIGVEVEAQINNGVRLDRFYPPETKNQYPLTVSMLYHTYVPKGAFVGLKALSRIKKKYSEIRIIVFGMFDKPEIDLDFEYYLNPSYYQLLNIYQSSHIFLFPSQCEGWGMTPLEAMACKCAVVGTKIGSIESIYNGDNVELIIPGDVDSAFCGIESLILNRDKLNQIAEEGFKSVQEYTWDKSAVELEKAFINAMSHQKKNLQ
ncbi:MAG: glycosyltransferase family 4 protein [Fibrobacter sp.]|jgi:glycosyltransferase involved in cell wall biosynthesis|nr:glycosyltransferase family 4 protein [Fibrobacter sp.]